MSDRSSIAISSSQFHRYGHTLCLLLDHAYPVNLLDHIISTCPVKLDRARSNGQVKSDRAQSNLSLVYHALSVDQVAGTFHQRHHFTAWILIRVCREGERVC